MILTVISSFWIDRLYALPDAPLSFPDEIEQRRHFRHLVFGALFYFCLIHLAKFPVPASIYLAIASYFLILVTITDLEQYVIFDRVLLPFCLIGVIRIFHLNLSVTDSFMAFLAGGLAFFLLAVVTNGGIGGGDIKLVAVLGLWLGTEKLFDVLTAGLIIGGIAALILLISKQKKRKSVLAYGPYFALTAIYFLLQF